ncbi:hypothetical protein OROHE_025321 [Orobanche hederae]
MEGIFGRIECRTKSDSIVMRILRSAMDEAHEKLQSIDGPIQFLHDRSTFYELAAILVEGGLDIVQEEKTDITEDNCNKILSDLTEIKSWLQGRIEDMKQLIVDKDRELTERLENELKLQESMELKEKEILYLHEKLEQPGRGKNDDIFRLKSSVDQQVSNIKQKLEDEKKILGIERRNRKTRVSSPNISFDFLDKERNGSPAFAENAVRPNNQNVLIGKMSLDIDILKETLDRAFGRMESIEVFPLEKQWRCAFEKDVESILVKGFVSDIKQSLDVEPKKKKKTRVGFSSDDDWFELMNEMRNLCCELKGFFTINDVHERGSSTMVRSSSEPLSDITYIDEEEDGEVDGKTHVAKMKKNFESIIRKQVDELNRLKREEGSFSRVGREKGSNGLERRIQDVITSLDSFTKKEQQRSRISKSDASVKRGLEIEIEKLKEERDGLFFRISVMEDTHRLVLRGMSDDFRADREKESHDNNINSGKECDRGFDELFYLESIIKEDVYVVVFHETVKQWNEISVEKALGSLLKEDMYTVFLREMVKAWRSEKDACTLECLIREDIYHSVIIEAVKDSHVSLLQSESLKRIDVQEYTPRSRKFETDKLDSLLKCLEAEEDLMLSANSEIKEHNVNNNLVILNCEEMDERDAIGWLITDDETTFISVSEKLEKALQQLYTSKELLVELEQSLKVSEDLEDNFELEDDGVGHAVRSDSVLAVLVQFQRTLGDVEHMIHENIESKSLRLEVSKREVDTLKEHVALIRKRKLLYKKAFLSRCRNLKLAEAEVDLLGDQVESLLYLVERIYFELNRNAKALSCYFEVYDILKLIERVLNDGRWWKPKS